MGGKDILGGVNVVPRRIVQIVVYADLALQIDILEGTSYSNQGIIYIAVCRVGILNEQGNV